MWISVVLINLSVVVVNAVNVTLDFGGAFRNNLAQEWADIQNPNSVISLEVTNLNAVIITRNSFTKLQNLQSLKLSGNITYIENEAFISLNNLRQISITNCGISNVSFGAFHKLENLSYLNLNGNSIKEIRISSNLKLEALILSNNKLESLNENYFLKIPAIKRIDLSSNNISAISSGTFNDCVNLGILDLSSNKITHFERYVFLKLRKLSFLYLNQNKLTEITVNNFNSLENLTRLDLSYNEISKVDRSAFDNLTNLQFLRLSNNRISYLDKDLLHFNKQLFRLYLHNNLLKKISPEFFGSTLELDSIDITNNLLKEFHITDNLKNLRILNLQDNKIEHMNCTAKVPMKLKYLYLSNNNLTYLDSLQNLTVLKELFLANNKLKKFSMCISNQLNSLNLMRNKIHLFQIKGFCNTSAGKNNGSLKNLDLNSNNLTWININDIKERHPHLILLDLRYNPLNGTVLEDANNTEFVVISTVNVDQNITLSNANQSETDVFNLLNRYNATPMNIIWIAVGCALIVLFLSTVLGVCKIKICKKSNTDTPTIRASTLYDDVLFQRKDDETYYEVILPPLPNRNESLDQQQAVHNIYIKTNNAKMKN